MNTRVALLQAVFSEIAQTRMAGLPVVNPRLHVEALGFEPLRRADAIANGLEAEDAALRGRPWVSPLAVGVLITPWFMNLVWLPLRHDDAQDGVGRSRPLRLGAHELMFIGAHEPALGAFAACSLFSPMQDFGDAAMARATAVAVLDMLRAPPPAPLQPAVPVATAPEPVAPAAAAQAAPLLAPVPPAPGPVPSRRGFLFGRPRAAV